jgi:hypothetical protein
MHRYTKADPVGFDPKWVGVQNLEGFIVLASFLLLCRVFFVCNISSGFCAVACFLLGGLKLAIV